MKTDLEEMGHSQPPTTVATDNTVAKIIVNGTAKQKTSRAIDTIFYWFRERIRQNHFHIFWEEGKKNLAYYVTKYHPIWHHRTMRPRYKKTTKKYLENSKDQQTGAGRGCSGTNNTGVTWKPDNHPKGIRNPIPQKPDNSLKGICNLVPNGIYSQWARGLTVPT